MALAADKRLDDFTNVPAFKELGIDSVQGIDRGATVPAGTPPERIEKLAEAMRYAASKPECKEGMRKVGFQLLDLGPAELA